MRRFTLPMLVAVAFVLLTASAFGAAPGQVAPNTMVPPGPEFIDGTYRLGPEDELIRELAAAYGPRVATGAQSVGDPVAVGESITVTVSDNGLNTDYDETFYVVLDGEHGIILVSEDAWNSYAVDGVFRFDNPNGDGSSDWARTEDVLTMEQLEYLLDEFDQTIYPTATGIFGEPLARGAEGQKVWILIHNIRDEAYYDPTATSYIAGYFSPSEDAANNKNMMHIDSYDWANRTGPDAARPYLYEGVFAHEFEHLVHFDQDADEESWVDEGLADLSAYLCGYGHSSGHIMYYVVYHPFTALTFWGGGLEDYGASYLFQLYLWEHYGGTPFVSALVQNQANGIEGVSQTLADFGANKSFDQIFDDWTVANYLDDTRREKGAYGYETLDMGGADSNGYTIQYALDNFWFGPPLEAPFTYTGTDLAGSGPQPYTAQYWPFTSQKKATEYLDGEDFAGTLPYSGTYEWYSGAAAWAWYGFGQSFDIPAGGATLNFQTFYEIEEDWDYGYVEVYDRDTGEWYTLDAAGTVDYVAHAQDNPNTPAGREPMDYEAAGRWYAFTGNSGGWQTVSMDLTPFADHTIDLYFRTWQDGAFTLQMMYVDDIEIPEIGFFDDVESGPGNWGADGWYITDGVQANGFGAQAMDVKVFSPDVFPAPAVNEHMELRSLRALTVDASTQDGWLKLPATPASSGRTQIAIVTNHANHILTSDYVLTVE